MTTHLPTATLPPGYLLRRMRPADTARTARLHRRLLPNGLFPRLGQRFVRRWHATFLDTPSATGLTVVHQGEVVAFVLATLDQRLYLNHVLRRHRWPLMWRGALGLLVRPAVLAHFVRTRLRAYARHLVPGARRLSTAAGSDPTPGPTRSGATAPRATQAAGDADRRVRVAVVHAVVTSEQARGRGCARALLDTVVAAARRARADHVALVTDVPDPATGQPVTGAAAMYEALGWDRVAVRRHRDGRWIAEYRLPLVVRTVDLAGTGTSPGDHGLTRTGTERPA
jgi:GNAT superfamily N-acetyltransferase